MTALLVVGYMLLCIATIAEFKKSDFRVLAFEDGILVGLVFFIAIPTAFLFYDGEIRSVDMLAGPFHPVEDWPTSINLGIGWAMILLFHAICRVTRAPATLRRISEPQAFTVDVLYLFGAIYVACTIFTFIVSGRAAGGHWQENLEESLRSSTSLVIIGNFANVYRGAIFALLYTMVSVGQLPRRRAIMIGFAVAMFDVLLTFNRITVAYFAISLLFMYKRYFPVIAVFMIISIPTMGYLSVVWTIVRGLALVDGYSLSGFVTAFGAAQQALSDSEFTIGQSMNGIFDSENIIVFDWLVKNVGDSFPVLYGYTFILRPLTVLVPSTIWTNKPGVFGILVGYDIQGIDGLALNSTLFGEALGNFYVMWPFALFFALLLIAYLYRALAVRWPVVGPMSFFVAFAMWRFDMAFAFISLVAIVAFLVALSIWRRIHPGPRSRPKPRFPVAPPDMGAGRSIRR